VDDLRCLHCRGRSNLVRLGVRCGFQSISIGFSDTALPARAWQTLGLLLTPLLAGTFVLIPGQSRTALALELIVLAALVVCLRLAVDLRAGRAEQDTLSLGRSLCKIREHPVPGLVSYLCLAVVGHNVAGTQWGWFVLVRRQRSSD